MNKKECRAFLEYINEQGKQVFGEGDYIICRVKNGNRYVGKIIAICGYQENEEADPEYVIYLNTARNKMSYSGEIIKTADIVYICKNPVDDLAGYPYTDERQDQSRFVNMIVALGHDKEKAEIMYKHMKELIALNNIPLSSALSDVIQTVKHNTVGKCQDELIEISNKLVDAMTQVFQTNTDLIRKSVEETINSQNKRQ